MRDIQLFIKKEILLLLLLLIIFINPDEKGPYFVLILAIYFITIELFSFLNSLDKLGILLILFSISYSIFYSFHPNEGNSDILVFILLYTITPITFYAIGKYFSVKYRSYKIYYFLFLFLSLGFSFLPAISIIYVIIENGYVGERSVRLLTRDSEFGGPVLGAFFTMNMAAIGTIFVQSAKKIENRIKYISLGAFIISVLCVLRVGSRTQLGIAVISLLVTLSYSIIKQSFRKNIRLLLAIAITLIVIFFSISTNSPILNILEQRNNDSEQLLNANGRTDRWNESFNNFATNPFGWEKSSSQNYSHNLWLDVARVGGIIPFIFLSFYTILCIYLVIKTLKISPHNLYFNTTVLVLFIGFYALFFVEPIMEGMYYVFFIFCIFIGILSGLNKTALSNKNNSRKYPYVNFEYSNKKY